MYILSSKNLSHEAQLFEKKMIPHFLYFLIYYNYVQYIEGRRKNFFVVYLNWLNQYLKVYQLKPSSVIQKSI